MKIYISLSAAQKVTDLSAMTDMQLIQKLKQAEQSMDANLRGAIRRELILKRKLTFSKLAALRKAVNLQPAK